MKKRLTIFSVIILCILGFVTFWAYKYYGDIFIELPDNRNYASIEKRACEAMKVAERHNLNTNYCLFVDYGIPSGTPRLFVWSFKDKKVVARTYVMHGSGMGSTAEKPVFSNKYGSNCSSLGRFIVTKEHGAKLKRSYRLKGLDINNKSAFSRGLMIHGSKWVDIHCWKKHIPLHEPSCQGCVTVSSRGMTYLEKLINSEKKNLLLWSYCNYIPDDASSEK